MATVDEVVRDVLASIATDAQGIAAAKWVDNRHKEMMSKVRFRHLREVGELPLPGVYDTGTVSVTRGSTSVTGVGTQFETDLTAGAQEYYYFRTGTVWYKIASVTNETTLVLATAFAEEDVSAGGYKIVKRHHPLAPTARWIGDFVHTRLRTVLKSDMSLTELDMIAPGRTIAGNIPTYAVEIGEDSDGYKKYEVYPPPENSELLHYVYWKIPTTLAIDSTIPQGIDPWTLKEGVLVDLYRYEKARAIRAGNIEQAATWRNEEQTQQTRWARIIKDAIRTSRGSDDLTLILNWFGAHRPMRDQQTARDYVRDNWSR